MNTPDETGDVPRLYCLQQSVDDTATESFEPTPSSAEQHITTHSIGLPFDPVLSCTNEEAGENLAALIYDKDHCGYQACVWDIFQMVCASKMSGKITIRMIDDLRDAPVSNNRKYAKRLGLSLCPYLPFVTQFSSILSQRFSPFPSTGATAISPINPASYQVNNAVQPPGPRYNFTNCHNITVLRPGDTTTTDHTVQRLPPSLPGQTISTGGCAVSETQLPLTDSLGLDKRLGVRYRLLNEKIANIRQDATADPPPPRSTYLLGKLFDVYTKTGKLLGPHGSLKFAVTSHRPTDTHAHEPGTEQEMGSMSLYPISILTFQSSQWLDDDIVCFGLQSTIRDWRVYQGRTLLHHLL